MEKKHCPECGGFSQQGLKDVYAKNHEGKTVIVSLYAESCSKCGWRKLEKYEDKLSSMNLLPYNS